MAKRTLREEVEELDVPQHVCCIGEAPEEQLEALLSFVRTGLKRRQQVVAFLTPETTSALRQALSTEGADVAGLVSVGALDLQGPPSAWLELGARLDPERALARLEASHLAALRTGFGTTRFVLEMTWATEELGRGLAEFELALNELLASSRALALCLYRRQGPGPRLLRDVLLAHPQCVLEGELRANPGYVPPRSLRAPELAEQELQRALSALRTGHAAPEVDLERYGELLQTLQEGLWTLDGTGTVTFVNARLAQLLGRPPAAMVGRPAEEFVHPDEREGHALQRANHAAGMPGTYERRLLCLDGSTRTMSVASSILRDTRGHAIGAMELFTDLRDRDELLWRHRVTARTLANLNRDLSEVDQVQEILQLIKEETGAEHAAIRLRSGADYPFYLADGQAAPCDLGVRDACLCSQVLQGRLDRAAPTTSPGGSFHLSRAEQAGTLSPKLDRRCVDHGFASMALIPLRHASDCIGLLFLAHSRPDAFSPELVAFLEDLGASIGIAVARRRADAGVRANEARFRQIFESTADGVFLADREGRIVEVNPAGCRMLAAERERVLGLNLAGLEPDLAAGKVQELGAQVSRDEGLHHTGVWRRPDGSRFPVEVQVSPLQYSGRRVLLAVARDITERLRLEQQLRQSQKLQVLGRLAGNVAHDFNNLLSVLLADHEFLATETRPTDPLREAIDEIGEVTKRARGLTQQLLAFSRQQAVEPRVTELGEALRRLEPVLHRVLGDGVRLELGVGAPAWILIDPARLEQAVVNLATNAREAMGAGGLCTLTTGRKTIAEAERAGSPALRAGEWCTLTVTDRGCGMPPEVLEHLFEPFFTTKASAKARTARDRGNAGLGLATVHGIIEQGGGFVTVSSKPGEGTSFVLHFPPSERAAAPAPSPKSSTAPPPGPGATVLVAEDNDPLRLVVRRILEKVGFRVLIAESAEQALDLGRNWSGPIGLLLTDVVMPGMNGAELARKMREVRPELRVLYMSGYSEEVRAAHGELTPMLDKPFTASTLVQTVREVLQRDAASAAV